jgi:hypothetical protein
MGSFSTIKALKNRNYSDLFTRVILFDPADYLIDNKISDTEEDSTWSGAQEYSPTSQTISKELQNINSTAIIHVAHLILRNYSSSGYVDKEYLDRGNDHPTGCPRLNTEMVKSFYNNISTKNRGRFIEVPGIPHGFTRDGKINKNLLKISQLTAMLLSESK